MGLLDKDNDYEKLQNQINTIITENEQLRNDLAEKNNRIEQLESSFDTKLNVAKKEIYDTLKNMQVEPKKPPVDDPPKIKTISELFNFK